MRTHHFTKLQCTGIRTLILHKHHQLCRWKKSAVQTFSTPSHTTSVSTRIARTSISTRLSTERISPNIVSFSTLVWSYSALANAVSQIERSEIDENDQIISETSWRHIQPRCCGCQNHSESIISNFPFLYCGRNGGSDSQFRAVFGRKKKRAPIAGLLMTHEIV